MGVNRAMLATMIEAYTEEDLGDGKSRIVLKLKPWLSPVKAAVIPLARNVPELLEISNKIENDLRKLGIGRIELENSGNIGKNYRSAISSFLCLPYGRLQARLFLSSSRPKMRRYSFALSLIAVSFSK